MGTSYKRTCPIQVIGTVLLLFYGPIIWAGSGKDTDSLKIRLENLSAEVPALNEIVNISVTDVTIEEFLRAVANSSGLNINVDPALDIRVVNNFTNVRVLDILLFLYEQYPIELTSIGNIINVRKPPKEELITPEVTGIRYDSLSGLFSFDYYEENLNRVAKEITRLSGYNVILAPGIENTIVSGFIQNKPFENALEKFAFSNNLVLNVTNDQFYILEPKPKSDPQDQHGQRNQNQRIRNDKEDVYVLDIEIYSSGKIKVNAINAPIDETIREVSEKSNHNYFFSSPIEGKTTLQITGITYPEFIENVLTGTRYIYQKEDGIYVIGENVITDLKNYRVFQFQNRTIENLSEFIPEDLTDGLILKEFPELNCFLISGPNVKVEKIEAFFNEIDKIVPVVLIDVIIVDVKKSYVVSTGVDAGLGDQPVETQGKVFPEIDMQLGSKTINDIINNLNGFGWTNLGNVSPNFYMTIKAMEDQGLLKVRSTPRLSTLNGHEAIMSIGEMEYYLEEQSNIIGTQNPQLETIKVYKSVNAQLTVTIRPIVAGDEQITLDIVVEQSDFTERISKYAPPGSVSRKFESQIRVKNQDVILLGGLEEKSSRESARGVPWLSRIPVLKWIFSSRTKERSNTKLNIFIRPTIIA